MKRSSAGFSLIELMVTMAIVGLLARFAIPAYRDFVLRGNTVAATSSLAAMRAKMEQYYQDNRTYVAANGFTPPCATATTVTDSSNATIFTLTCSGSGDLTAASYLITATGAGQMAGFTYKIDQANSKQTTVSPAWGGASYQCWIVKRGQTC